MAKTYKGTVGSVTLSGLGVNSAQLEVYMTNNPDGADPATFIVLASPATEPYVFEAYSSLAAAALSSGKPTEVTYDTIQGNDNYLTGQAVQS